jgi:hypothetical protein
MILSYRTSSFAHTESLQNKMIRIQSRCITAEDPLTSSQELGGSGQQQLQEKGEHNVAYHQGGKSGNMGTYNAYS